MEKIIFDFFLFLAVLGLTCFLPGRAYLYFKKINLSILETLTLSLSLGLVFFTFINFIFGVFGLRWLAFVFIGFIDLLFIYFRVKKSNGIGSFLRPHWTKANKIFILILILGIFGQVSLVATSGLPTSDGGLSFVEARDAFWHVGLIEQLTKKIPPTHPGFSPLPLTNYHYFYDLFVSSFKMTYPFSTLDLYFRFIPILLSLLLGLSVFVLTRRLFVQEETATLAVFLTYFTGSLAFLIPFFLPGHGWGESSFWVSQTFRMLINPPFSLSLSLFLIGIFALHQKLLLPSVFLLGTLIGFKVYGGIIALGAEGLVSLWQLVREKRFNFLVAFFATFLLSLLTFLSNNTLSGAGGFLIFAPGWYLRAMVENPDRLYIVDWVLREETLLFYGSILGVLRLRFQEFLIFMAGNLGLRVIGLLGIATFFVKLKKLTSVEVFLLAAAVISFLMPMLFIQKGSVANTIQFFYYLLVILNLYTAKVIWDFLKSKNIFVRLVSLGFILVLSLPTTIKTWQEYNFPSSRRIISKEELGSLNFLKKETPKDSTVLLFPSGGNIESLYVGALSSRRTYYSDRLMSENTLKDFQERERLSLKFFTTQDLSWSKKFLQENNISYVYHLKADEPKFNGLGHFLPVVFENEIVSVYRVP